MYSILEHRILRNSVRQVGLKLKILQVVSDIYIEYIWKNCLWIFVLLVLIPDKFSYPKGIDSSRLLEGIKPNRVLGGIKIVINIYITKL